MRSHAGTVPRRVKWHEGCLLGAMGARAYHVEWRRGCLPDVECPWLACATRRYRRAGLVARSRKRAGAARTAAVAYGRRCRRRRRGRPRWLRQEVDVRGRRRRHAAAAAVRQPTGVIAVMATATRRERELLSRTHRPERAAARMGGGRASRRRECGGATEPAPGALPPSAHKQEHAESEPSARCSRLELACGVGRLQA